MLPEALLLKGGFVICCSFIHTWFCVKWSGESFLISFLVHNGKIWKSRLLLLLMVRIILRTSRKVSRDTVWFWRWVTKRNIPVCMSPNIYPPVILYGLVAFPSSQVRGGGRSFSLGVPWGWVIPHEFQTRGAGDCSDQEFCSPREGAIWFLNPEARAGNGFSLLQVPFRAERVIWNLFPIGNMLQEIKRRIFHLLRE